MCVSMCVWSKNVKNKIKLRMNYNLKHHFQTIFFISTHLKKKKKKKKMTFLITLP